MRFPLNFWDISLWLVFTALILLATSELISQQGKTNILISKKRLKNAALIIGILFLITVAIRIYGIITSI